MRPTSAVRYLVKVKKMNLNRIISEDIERILAADLPWECFKGVNVLVTGASGFLPAYIVECLAELNNRGYGTKVFGLIRNLPKARARFAHLLDSKCLSLIAHDVSIPFPENLPKIDYIVHAASQASPKFYGVDPVGTMTSNTLGTAYALEFGRRQKVRGFLYFSSGEVYGIPRDPEFPIVEDQYGYLDPTNVRSCYAESKRCGETMCVSWAHQFGVPARIVRPFHTYGPGMALDDGRVFSDFVADVVEARNIVLKSDGMDKRPFCYLADATEGFLCVLMKGDVGRAYNVANPNAEVSIGELANTIAGLFPERGLSVVQEVRRGSGAYIRSPLNRALPDIERISKLGWNPHTSIREGFQRTIESYISD
jgi:UDP-glucuronate decarboxylase